MLWNSSILVERVSNTVVKSASGSVYILIGKMYMNADTGKTDSVQVDLFLIICT